MTCESNQAGFDLAEQFVHLASDGGARCVLVDSIRSQADSREELSGGRLMGAIRMTKDPDHWEMHPDGDELIILLSGSMDVILREVDKHKVVSLRDSGVCIVPRSTWHRQAVLSPCEFIFVTPAKGTQLQPL
jgi:mannose-6-phosphate isomerase-like protein (cupin superfamily)